GVPTQAARLPRTLPSPLPVTAGSWGHLDPPTTLPKWVGCDGFAGLIAYNTPSTPESEPPQTRLVMRAVALPEVPNPAWAVVLDMPLSKAIEERVRQETGIRIGEISASLGSAARPVVGRAIEDRPI